MIIQRFIFKYLNCFRDEAQKDIVVRKRARVTSVCFVVNRQGLEFRGQSSSSFLRVTLAAQRGEADSCTIRSARGRTDHGRELHAMLATGAAVTTALAQVDREKIYQWINELSSPETRENALLELSKKRESVPDLAPMLWHSCGTIAALLQEIVNIYPSINPPTLTAHQSNRVCNALALLQCVASHPETRSAFLAAHIPLFLYPFLHTVSKTRPFEYLRLTSLGVIGALVKTDEQEVINFLLTTEIIPLCLRIMESGSELSKTVATFILQKILLDDTGLAYICQTYERFSHVAMILGKMVLQLSKEPSARLLKHVVRCYLRLSDNPRAREALRQCLPDQLKDTTFAQVLKDDTTTKRWLAQLVKNLQEGQVTDPRGIPLPPQ
uniref:CCR4-NOT transcription complex subunit 9 n=7 Tax=Teleostei TaxID=32443 RepID=A0A8C9V1M2_SCLFO